MRSSCTPIAARLACIALAHPGARAGEAPQPSIREVGTLDLPGDKSLPACRDGT
jgi:hypothetical protein